MRRTVLTWALALGLAATPAAAAAGTEPSRTEPSRTAVLRAYAADTWRSMAAMVEPRTGMPSDKVSGDLRTRAKVTSPTNVGTYLWSTLTARDLKLIGQAETTVRVARALAALDRLEHDTATGLYYNWYDPATLQIVRTWPDSGDPVRPFVSSVDNAWLAVALMMVKNALPGQAAKAGRILSAMDFSAFYDPDGQPDAGTGLMTGGYWPEKPEGCSQETDYAGTGTTVYSTCHRYGAMSETRIVTYVAVALAQVPANHYFGLWRTFPDTCDWGWADQKPQGTWQTFQGVRVFEGTYGYRGMRYVPTWGGSMFEALMANLMVPEETWGAKSWGRNHPVHVAAQIEHGLREAKYGYWGFSPSNNPAGGYREYGVDPLGMDTDGYTSDQERTSTDPGYGDCRPAKPEPERYGDGVVTPHASFLALRYAPGAALDNLARLKAGFDAYGPGGFYDAVAVRSGQVSKEYLALDQGMVMGALGNALARDNLRRYFTPGGPERLLKPVLGLEEWDARLR
ncbi:glucoamylase family protein [Sphaerisporangium sp. TRM90804]|uniref:glucoamylase family protein n=1 Tax=Sphaerisporangium sp. TRM90804 TaxID=3031113 RepID=UPI0024490A17|nr:glucoamylase family protein [Sphaerisporangium sp. TRM90804]MDH2427127.1 glucoamylase family protein [Sphaerisporangium sp. TRM90804]